MSYRPTFGNNYDNYNNPNTLGLSNVSKNYNRHSFRSTSIPTLDGAEDHGGLGEVEFMLEN